MNELILKFSEDYPIISLLIMGVVMLPFFPLVDWLRTKMGLNKSIYKD